MSEQSYSSPATSAQLAIQQAALLKPFSWLTQGWQDIRRHPQASLAHGLAVSALILISLIITSVHIYIIAAVVSGFMLIGPIMAAGLCELSRRDENGEASTFDGSLDGLRHCQSKLNHLAGILLGFSVLWFIISGLVLFLTVGSIAPSLELTLWGDFLTYVTPSQIALYTVVGGLLATIVFVVTVVSVPTIIENNIPAVEAMIVSFKVTIANLPTMIVWSALIVLLTVIGFTTFLIGMVVIYPLLGHATWHAYRDLVESKG